MHVSCNVRTSAHRRLAYALGILFMGGEYMLAEYKRKTNIGVGVGIIFQIVGNVLTKPDDAAGVDPLVGLLFLFVGLGFFIWGCMSYSKGKGYHPAWGLLGLLSIVGLIVLVLFPDKYKDT